ncbi:hypothetical protein AXK11_04550 [Cephaloticoccus primus]|uniref:Invasion protein n=1 Tax=Cephaloticoccus primus TaxID=1548207 RepID=A0A139SPE6_9BACT|nr:hypothetical protein [Cephaloticoccus primus]KXU36426.1 hypothetical protein AXK11_04550 [Cephaloticoccus primus]
MTAYELHTLQVLHVLAVLVLVGTTFFACAAEPATRKRVLIWSGIASLVVLLTGTRLLQGLYGMEGGWAWVKMVCWLGISALGGVAYRRRKKAALWMGLTLALAALALVMVFVKPF